jgi:hypothetical protein
VESQGCSEGVHRRRIIERTISLRFLGIISPGFGGGGGVKGTVAGGGFLG